MGLLKEIRNGDTLDKEDIDPDLKCYEKISRAFNTFKK